MGTTTNFGWPYPEETDLADVPADMAALAAAIDSDVATLTAPPSFSTYTPTVGNAGSATFSTKSGWSAAFGKWVFWNAYLVCNADGSGSSLVSVTSPSAPDRSTRQVVSLSRSTAGGNVAGVVIAFTGGSGSVWDRLTLGNGTDLEGSDITSGSIHVVQGMYRAA